MIEPKLSIYDTYMCDAAMDIIFANIAALEAENAALKAERRWIPVSERLPEKGQDVLISYRGGVYSAYYKGVETILDDNNNCVKARAFRGWDDHSFAEGRDFPAHWMPCPEPPEEVTE